MPLPVTVPRLGWSMEEGTLLEWLKRDGDPVRPGEPLYVLEGEKAAQEIEAVDAGILRIPPGSPAPGQRVKVGQVLAYLTTAGEVGPAACEAPPAAQAPTLGVDVSRLSGSGASRPVMPPDVRRQPPGTASPAQAPGKMAVTPRARRAARELGIDWTGLAGTGRNGRVRERDVRLASAGKFIPHTSIRRTIASRMVAGVSQAAPVTLHTRVDATRLVELRDQFRAPAGPAGFVPGYSELFIKLAALALREHPLLQAQWRDHGLFVPERIHVALAVDTEAGLLAPVVRDADRLSLKDLVARCRQLLRQARNGGLTAAQMQDATFTISNLGGLGVDAFTPIIQLPQSAVLGIGRIVREPAVHQGAVVARARVTLSLTFDHRVLDGAPAARFLDTLRRSIEQPDPALLA